MIEMTRGCVTVRDRAALEVAANGLYGVPDAYVRLALPVRPRTCRVLSSWVLLVLS